MDFTTTSQIWDGPVVERIDERRDYGETRIVATREIDGRLMVVVFTWRDGANPREKDAPRRKSKGAAMERKIDWTAFDAIIDKEITAQIRHDPDVGPELDAEWFAAAIGNVVGLCRH